MRSFQNELRANAFLKLCLTEGRGSGLSSLTFDPFHYGVCAAMRRMRRIELAGGLSRKDQSVTLLTLPGATD